MDNNKKDLLPLAIVAGAVGAITLIVGFAIGRKLKKIKEMVAEEEILYREEDLKDEEESGCGCSSCGCSERDFTIISEEYDEPTENVADINDFTEFGVINK